MCYFPKVTDFVTITDQELQKAMYKINHLLEWFMGKTAHEIYYEISKRLIPVKQRKSLAFAFRA
jgi:IS30 family transposase